MGIGTGIRRGVFGLITREKSIGFSTPPLHLAPGALLRGNVCALILVQLKPLRVPLLKRRPNHPAATRRPTPRPTLRPTLPLQIPLPPRPLRPQARVPQRRRPAPLARPLLRRPAILLPRPLPASLQLPLPPPPPSLAPARSIPTVALTRNARRIRTWTHTASKGRWTVRSAGARRKRGGVVRIIKYVGQWGIRNGQNVSNQFVDDKVVRVRMRNGKANCFRICFV